MFSVGSETEAKRLLTLACSTNYKGEFVARELAHKQSITNLKAFGDRLEKFHKEIIKNKWCECD